MLRTKHHRRVRKKVYLRKKKGKEENGFGRRAKGVDGAGIVVLGIGMGDISDVAVDLGMYLQRGFVPVSGDGNGGSGYGATLVSKGDVVDSDVVAGGEFLSVWTRRPRLVRFRDRVVCRVGGGAQPAVLHAACSGATDSTLKTVPNLLTRDRNTSC